MANISMVRVDERLVHGQILIKWIQVKDAKRILIIDNEIVNDPIMKNILNMSVPKEIDLKIYDLEEGVRVLTGDRTKDSAIILVRNLWMVKLMHEKGVKTKEINIGRIPSGVGRKKIHPNVFLSDEDIDIVNYFKEESVSLIIQMVPDSQPVELYDLL